MILETFFLMEDLHAINVQNFHDKKIFHDLFAGLSVLCYLVTREYLMAHEHAWRREHWDKNASTQAP
jgi:hypothetical protein